MLLTLLGLFRTEHQQQLLGVNGRRLLRHVISHTVADVQITAASAAAAAGGPGAVRRRHQRRVAPSIILSSSDFFPTHCHQ